MTRLNGKTALVTGSTDGVGRVVAKRLGQAGARVLVHGRNRERGERLVAEIEEDGGRAEFLAADLSCLAGVRRLAAAVQQRTDRLDILINNAGIGTGGSGAPRQTSADGHELRFAVNYLAGFLLTRLLLPLIKQSAPARIVNVASDAHKFRRLDLGDLQAERRGYGFLGLPRYGETKLMNILFTRELARRLEGTGVTVNSVLAGPTRTGGVETFARSLVGDDLPWEEAQRRFMREHRPNSLLQRLIEPEEIANMVAYLSSDLASATTGGALRVDGGYVDNIVP
jgi:NAD(P)-dependent dehydrogenase (short-subunit alcohol dehydrogenase family)